MRDFQVADPDRTMWGDETGMTENGFKRFRRKATRPLDRAEAEEMQEYLHDLGTSDEATWPEPEPRPQLPATIRDDWDVIPQITPARRSLDRARAPLAALNRGEAGSRAFDLLRTRLLQALREHGWRRVAVAAPVSGCGATFTAVNLALSMARVPSSRTVLMDMNLRAPGISAALGLPATGDIAAFLQKDLPIRENLVRIGETLALGLSGAPDRNASERLLDPHVPATLDRMTTELKPDMVLFDMPAILEHDDVAAFLPQVDGILLVADGTRTTAAQIRACERVLNGHAPVLGVVLNRGRDAGKGAAA